jgi:phosphonate transport system substrate-binding protein
MRLLAVPLYRDAPLYQSYLIVASEDRSTSGIIDLAGKVFAYSDPDSNSGFLAPQVALIGAGRDPRRFFGRTFFSWTHRDVVLAVAEGVADGGSVDGYVWDTLEMHHPDLTARTRVVARSQEFGFPPFVTPRTLPIEDFEAIQRVMLDMADDPAGLALLRDLNLDGFVAGESALFDGIRRAVEIFERS